MNIHRTMLGFIVAFVLSLAALASPLPAAAPSQSGPAQLAFTPSGQEFKFDTGVISGILRQGGASRGLSRVTAYGQEIAGAFGLFSHYRLLDAEARYGHAAWDWTSTAQLLSDGGVEARWLADEGHPFDLAVEYRWTSADTLDLVTRVTARKDLGRLEVFLASYFQGFGAASAYVKENPENGGKPGLLEARQSAGVWQMFPRDEAAVAMINDGRWKRPPNPVEWKIMPALAGPLAVRRDAARGLVALVMAPAEDCFAVSMPYGEEGHRSLYLSLFGRDLKAGATASARCRLVVRRELTDSEAIAIYEAYARQAR